MIGSTVNKTIQIFQYMQAVLHDLGFGTGHVPDLSTPPLKMGERRTPAQMFQHTLFLLCLFGVKGVKRAAKSSPPLQ